MEEATTDFTHYTRLPTDHKPQAGLWQVASAQLPAVPGYFQTD